MQVTTAKGQVWGRGRGRAPGASQASRLYSTRTQRVGRHRDIELTLKTSV